MLRPPTPPNLTSTNDLRDRLDELLSGQYRIERELGGGGMSRVFVAEELALGRRVVVKVLAPELADGLSAERFGNLVASRLWERAGNVQRAYDAAQRWAIGRGSEVGSVYVTYLREQGRLGAAAGDREAAIAAYRHYLRLRARHEPMLDRDVATVRAELEKLERQSSGR